MKRDPAISAILRKASEIGIEHWSVNGMCLAVGLAVDRCFPNEPHSYKFAVEKETNFWLQDVFKPDCGRPRSPYWFAPAGKELQARSIALALAADLWDDEEFDL